MIFLDRFFYTLEQIISICEVYGLEAHECTEDETMPHVDIVTPDEPDDVLMTLHMLHNQYGEGPNLYIVSWVQMLDE
jgi:hypothetical protein